MSTQAAEHGPLKRKVSIDSHASSVNAATTEKKPRSHSIDSKSSWFWRSTLKAQDANDDGSDSTTHGTEHNAGTGDGDDGDDDDGDSKPKKDSAGIWSWLGYPSTTEQQTSADAPPPVDSARDPDLVPEPVNATEPPVEPAPPAEAKPYWRSFFWSSDTPASTPAPDPNQDSVVIDKSSSTETRETPAPPEPIPKPSNKKNVVVPTIASQFYPPSMNPQTSTSLLNKALKAINSMFAQNSPQHVNTKFAQFVKDMKANPEDIAGKKFVIVGVHGWFPTKLVRSVIGEPTGTSIKFCEQTVSGVRHYFKESHGLVIPHHAITSIPLEGEGKVEERVDRLLKNLLAHPGWMDALASADVILWSTHSQGTPVSTIMMQHLLEEKHINLRKQSVCMLAMAGISQGPFPSLKGNLIVKYFEADAARELFHFMDSSSEISQKYRHSLNHLLSNGIKTVLVGSLQDQVVPLYSAIMTSVSHPNILRAVYIDGHIYSEGDFLINLVTFALRLRNAGLSDHGLLTHISDVLAGDLYSWESGHSTIYEERDVYALAVQYLFESAPFHRTAKPTDIVLLDTFQAKVRQNPFYLPWAMRGICDDAAVLSDQLLRQELQKLRTLFEQWVPSSAKLREVKFRLEPLRARL